MPHMTKLVDACIPQATPVRCSPSSPSTLTVTVVSQASEYWS